MKTTLLVLSALFALTSAANDDAAAQQRFSVRSTLQKQLREGLAQLPADHSFVQLADDDMPSVAEARLQAAQMQAQLDQGSLRPIREELNSKLNSKPPRTTTIQLPSSRDL